jgi:hypothetical protein
MDVFEDLGSKSADHKLYNIYLILHHDFKDKCSDFVMETPCDTQTRDRAYAALMRCTMEGIRSFARLERNSWARPTSS